jgi:hypothetical protein
MGWAAFGPDEAKAVAAIARQNLFAILAARDEQHNKDEVQ